MLDAVAQYTRGLECGSSAETRATLSSNRAAAYCRLEMWAEALADACACAELQPRWAVAFKSKGAALHGLGQHAQALESYRVALSLDPADQDILLFLKNSEEFGQAEAEAQREDVQHTSAYATEAVEALPQAAGGARSKIEGGNESGGGEGDVKVRGAREVMTRWLKEEEGGEEGEDKVETMKAETTADEELDILNGPGGHEYDDSVERVHHAQAQQHHHTETHPQTTPTGAYGCKDYGKEAGTNSAE
jgi:tetratricopeptide (TPR) repeat protein